MIKVLIADDHQILIEGLKATLLDIDDITVVAEANDGYQVLKILESQAEVDVILMDINMPKLDGLECTKMVSKKFPDIKVIALTQYSEKRFVKRMIKYGASGYLLKDTSQHILETAIKKVHDGGKYFSDQHTLQLVNLELKKEDTKSLFPKLTGREIEILDLIGKEFSSTEIAGRLNISFHTVESHRSNLMLKAGVKNTAGLIRWAVRNDLIE
ncbi:MAG: hypothetical protein B6D61_02650 [Bacteroidetes bacterium 4484_249]|nr:MAG: hypothetical protein B6D61_02650 [Bacteroidetes bacterium 4484_249]